MAIYFGETKMDKLYPHVKASKVWKGDEQIYDSRLPAETVLFSAVSAVYGNQTVKLSKPLRQVRHGVKIYFGENFEVVGTSSTAGNLNGIFYNPIAAFKFDHTPPISISAEQLIAGNVINLMKSTVDFNNAGSTHVGAGLYPAYDITAFQGPTEITAKMADDTTLDLGLVIGRVAYANVGYPATLTVTKIVTY